MNGDYRGRVRLPCIYFNEPNFDFILILINKLINFMLYIALFITNKCPLFVYFFDCNHAFATLLDTFHWEMEAKIICNVLFNGTHSRNLALLHYLLPPSGM